MKILYALDKFTTSSGGADRLARGVARALSAAGHEVRVLQAGTHTEAGVVDNIPVRTRFLSRPRFFRDGEWTMILGNAEWHPLVEEEIESFGPDWVLTQNMLTPASVSAAKRAGVRSAIFFHGYRCLSPTFFLDRDALTCKATNRADLPFRLKLKWPLIRKGIQLHALAYRAATRVIANSRYVARVIERFYGREADVLYPIADLAAPPPPRVPDPSGPILFVKPQPVKGAEIFLALAAALPEQRFVVAGKASRAVRRRMARLPHVEHRDWVEDMDALYREAALLLMPSRLPEPFGRVLVEAGRHSLPAVASRTGAIPEVLGAGGILVDPRAEITDWTEAIRRALQPKEHAALAAAAYEQARDHLLHYPPERFAEIVSSEGSANT